MTSGTITRRSFIAAASTGFVAAASPRGSAASNLLIRSPATVTLGARGATLSGLRAAVQDIASAGGGALHINVSSVVIDTVDLWRNGPVDLPASTTIEGNGATLSFTGLGIAHPLFVGRDVSAIALRNLVAKGNNKARIGADTGGFARFELTSTAVGNMDDITIENLQISGFAGERWVQFLQRSPAGTMSGLRVIDVKAWGGSSLSPGAIAVSAAPIWFYGVDGAIDDVAVRRVSIDAMALKQGVVLFHRIANATLDAVSVANAGVAGARDDSGAYAIMAYADPGEMYGISIISPVIRGPRSCGIYLRGADDVRIRNPVIAGQTDKVADNLPKGAIAMNGCSGVTIEGGRLSDNAFDLSVADGGRPRLKLGVRDLTTAASRTSVILALSPGKGAVTGVSFAGCTLSGADRVFRIMNDEVRGRCYNDVAITGSTLHSATAANVIELTQGTPTAATGYRIEDVTVQANFTGIMASGLLGSLAIHRVTIEGLGRLDYGIVADDCPKLDWEDVTFRNMRSGYAFAARSLTRQARGTLRKLRFEGVANPSIRGSLKALD
ncbi:hypothetical protein SPHINGO361_100344 [Sphingomonas sp. EC-HK361]|uniref:hypothetical protein n=1 Tax=Sphingomonas sp. EC-HK361 TaxID=2038397 RepID=UPI001257E4C8|nr:hypothetical protein [Sphingomonas sp. EC-HK361]VVS98374.1 hypothetical protein SPHINGO361_100344 [Sphingomonas sp. EC-HK361]